MLSGRRMNMGIAQRKVAPPKMMYIHLQGRIAVLSICPTPKARRLAAKPPTEFPANQIPTRVGISSRVYQVEVRNMKPGVMVASATPSKNRTVKSPPKLLHAAVRVTTDPQNRVFADRYFPAGRRVTSILVGYVHWRYPM
jgi:hypothetical protein